MVCSISPKSHSKLAIVNSPATLTRMSDTALQKHFLSDKVEHFTESVIREMTRQAMQYGAINLAQGFPDFSAPAEIKHAAQEAIAADVNQYAITWGAKSLRDAIARQMKEWQGIEVDPEKHITVCCGSTMIPCHSFICRAIASRRLLAPHVIAYWFTSAAMASCAACLISAGAEKSGNPCARLMAPYCMAWRVISRMTDSVKCSTLSLRKCF